jgi:23S rRNA (adenine2503-C2)-methyltransferase
MKRDARSLQPADWEAQMKEWGEPRFRATQIDRWIWQKGVSGFGEMANIPKSLRERLDGAFAISPITQDVAQHSNDGTIKVRYRLHDGHLIEAVLIPVPKDNRFTVCVSSQVGCSLSCSFCATGTMKRERNISAAEIVDQVRKVNTLCEATYDHPLTNIVYMGMGEPLLAYPEVIKSIDRISSPDGLGMSAKRITVSTAGIAKAIRRLADDESKVNLALSLHAATDDKRNEIMPINESNNIEKLMDALKYYYEQTGNRISYEYIAFAGFNDSIEDAKALLRWCQHFPVRINIIEYNPIDSADFTATDPEQLDRFAGFLRKKGIMVTVRRSRGKDIDAACGQLANKG